MERDNTLYYKDWWPNYCQKNLTFEAFYLKNKDMEVNI